MKKAIISIVLVTLFSVNSNTQSSLTITDYFKKVKTFQYLSAVAPNNQRLDENNNRTIDEIKTRIIKTGEEFQGYGPGLNMTKFVIVDNANGYIKLMNGTCYNVQGRIYNGYYNIEEWAFFKDSRNVNYILSSCYSIEDVYEVNSEIRLYKINREQINSVEFSKYCVPVKIEDFLKSNLSREIKKYIKNFLVVYRLPRFGTDVKVEISFIKPSTIDIEHLNKEIQSKMKYKAIILGWDSRTPKYYVKAKIPK